MRQIGAGAGGRPATILLTGPTGDGYYRSMELVVTAIPIWILGLGVVVSALCLKAGARLVGLYAPLLRAVVAVVVLYPSGILASFVGTILVGPRVGFAAGLAAVLLVLKVLFSGTWAQTVVMWLLMVLAQAVVLAVAVFLTGLGLHQLMEHLEHYLPGREIEVGSPWRFLIQG